MEYQQAAISASAIPTASIPLFQHVLDTYASETNKTASVWLEFSDSELNYRPHPRSSTVLDILRHQLLSERRFFGEFLVVPEPHAAEVLPALQTIEAYVQKLVELATSRLSFLAGQSQEWWLGSVPFFDVERERIWVFWRRVLHTAHHRTQLTAYLRLLDKPVPSIYGPTADITWKGADPTASVEAAERK